MAATGDAVDTANSNIVTGAGSSSVQFTLPSSPQYVIQSVVATIDNTAGGATTATLTYADTNGEVIAKRPQGTVIPAGDTGTATFALRLSDDGGGGIKYGIENDGNWLHITTETTHGSGGFVVDAVVGSIHFFADDPITGEFRVTAPFARFDTTNASLRLLDSGETFFICAGAASWEFSDFSLGAAPIAFSLTTAASAFSVLDHNGNAIFRVDEDGALHGKTGKALTFDL